MFKLVELFKSENKKTQSAVTLFVICLICFVTDGPIGLVFNDKLPN